MEDEKLYAPVQQEVQAMTVDGRPAKKAKSVRTTKAKGLKGKEIIQN